MTSSTKPAPSRNLKNASHFFVFRKKSSRRSRVLIFLKNLSPLMAAYVRGVLASLLSKYVTLSEEELTVNLWQGRVELRDVALNVGALSLPLRARASVRTLALEVPWTRLMAASVRLVGSGLRVDLDDFSDQSPVLGPAPTAVSPTPPPPPPTTPPPQEVAVLLRRVKQLAVLELTDVVFVVRERIRVRAEKLTGGPFGQMDDDLAFEAGDLDFSHCLQLLDLTIEIDNVMVLHPVSVEVVLSSAGEAISAIAMSWFRKS
jgi:hypothetical protein